jgi:DNA gyrase subunit B
LTRRKTALDSGSMPHKLRDCKTRNVDEAEIFIVEGDSAGGSATQGRNVETQAILPLKGKILNVEKARIDKILGFEEIRTLIAALRVGIGNELDIAKLRYGKIIIMTDADVDGSHIRTLLLTFFFRQMPDLIRKGHIFIAQPPLYQVAKGHGKAKRAWYVLNEKTLEDSLVNLGLENAVLSVRDILNVDPLHASREPKEITRLEGDTLKRAIFLLARLQELVTIAERRGAKFADLLGVRSQDPSGKGRLPTRRVSWRGGDAYAWTEEQAFEIVSQKQLRLADTANGASGGGSETGNALTADHATIRELHENREMERLFQDLAAIGLSIDDYTLIQEESVTGEKLPSKFAWVLTGDLAKVEEKIEDEAADDESAETGVRATVQKTVTTKNAKVIEAASLPAILDSLQDLGRRGLEIKRFKGLGEMDAEQLWETTMDASKRVLLRVNWDMASNADAMFSVLMGEEVEPRRKFIEEHALEVKNLDV